MQNTATWQQREMTLPAMPRGYHIITDEIEAHLAEMPPVQVGLLHVFMMHTSAGLTINENADPTVRMDFEEHMNRVCPENAPYFKHTFEGPDDMPAHLKAALLDTSLVIPIKKGRLKMGTWQGVYLCEFRDRARPRTLTLTLQGQLEV